MADDATEHFGMQVTPAQKAKIERLAAQQGSTPEEAVLDAVDRVLENDEDAASAESVLDLTEDLCGSVNGARDLSTNPEHMEDYGQD